MVSCFVTHGVFPKESWRRFLGQDGAPPLFEKAWFTGSNPNPNPNPTPTRTPNPNPTPTRTPYPNPTPTLPAKGVDHGLRPRHRRRGHLRLGHQRVPAAL